MQIKSLSNIWIVKYSIDENHMKIFCLDFIYDHTNSFTMSKGVGVKQSDCKTWHSYNNSKFIKLILTKSHENVHSLSLKNQTYELNSMTKSIFVITDLNFNQDKTFTHNFPKIELYKNKWIVVSLRLHSTTQEIVAKFCISFHSILSLVEIRLSSNL